MINVTKTFLPPQEEYQAILKDAWDEGWITNRGSLVIKLEEALRSILNISNVICMTNGTLPIQIAIKTFNLKGEIITTPFSYVATASSIVWENCKPVFVDIEEDYWTINPEKIEAAITAKTSAIIATHVFGNPCDVESIEKIAKKNNLKVIYDAAHCFGVEYKNKSIFNFGDVSTCSFHATKLFHTGEGGAIFTPHKDLLSRFFYHHNFGHKGKEAFQGIGINAKMSELQAAMGLSVLPYVDNLIQLRESIVNHYLKELKELPVQVIQIRPNTKWNFSYFPIVFKSESIMLSVKEKLNNNEIFPRRYFYPSLNKLPYVDYCNCEVSEGLAGRILCLPLYHDLKPNEVLSIVEIIKREL